MRFSLKDILFIVNPNSGNGKIMWIISELKTFFPEVDYCITKDLKTLNQVFQDKMDVYSVFVIVGGDGTVQEVIKYLFRKDKYLAILPNGSGNGLARELNFKPSVEKVIQSVLNSKHKKIDVLEIANNYFLNVAGIGLDSYVAYQFQKSKTRGFLSYIVLTIKSIFTYKSIKVKVTINGDKPLEGKYMMVCFANAKQFGNNAYIAPNAVINDGHMDVVLVDRMRWYNFPKFTYQMFRNKISNSRYITTFQTDKTVNVSSLYTKVHIDGKPIESKGKFNVDIHSNSINIIESSAS